MKTGVIPTDGMIITEDTRFAPGTYVLPNGVTIGADGVTVEGEQTLLISPQQSNVGIAAQGRRGVTVRSLALSGFYHGLRFDDCQDVTVEQVNIRNTWEIEGIDTFLYLWLPIEKVYGGALLMNQVRGGAVRDCDFQHQLNGILLYGCTGVTVANNNASFNSGWGVYLSGTNDSVISDNQLDFCNRVYRRPEDGSIRVEADAAGIVMVKGASRNQILRNSCLCGGDGMFICGYEHPGVHESCSDNLIEDNDCRLSPNNAIESTFSRGNIFRRNKCSRSNYGFWMGYSWDNVLEDNEIEFNRFVGVAAEHAHGFIITNNDIKLNGEGVRLWMRGGPVLDYFPGYEVTYNFRLYDNRVESNRIGVNAYTNETVTDNEVNDLALYRNTFRDNRIGVQLDRVQNANVVNNRFERNLIAAIRTVGETGVSTEHNGFDNNRLEDRAPTRES